MLKWIVSFVAICSFSISSFADQKKILMMVPDDFMWPEYSIPRAEYEKAGFVVYVVAKSKEPVNPDKRNKAEYPASGPVKPDMTFDDVKLPLSGFDALTFVGGNGAWHDFFPTPKVHEILASAMQETMVVGLICASTGVLAVAGNFDGKGKPLAEGRKVVGYYKVESMLRSLGKVNFQAGGRDDITVVQDKNLITGRNQQSSKKFAEAVVARVNDFGAMIKDSVPSIEEIKKSISAAKDPEEKFEHETALMMEYRLDFLQKLSDPIPQERFDHARYVLKRLSELPHHQGKHGCVENTAYNVLGWEKLQKGDVAGAKTDLKRAGEVKTDAVLLSFGPDFALARALLQKGEREAVLEYLAKAEDHWNKGRLAGGKRAEVGKYRDMIARGEIPNFFMGK